MKVYQNATHITDVIFGNNNIKTAIAHEDLSYAEYVNDYGNGSYRYVNHYGNSSYKYMYWVQVTILVLFKLPNLLTYVYFN